MMSLPIVQVDAFTNQPFHGNPAAVCILPGARDAKWMQAVALENNLPETSFVMRQAALPDGAEFSLRWFTPATEVDLCGHATVAAAHVLWETGTLAAGQQARFHSKSGLLTADKRGDWIELDFPAKPEVAAEPPAGLIEALGIQPVYVGLNQFDYLVEVASEAEVSSAKPDFGGLKKVKARGIIVTSKADNKPGAGVPGEGPFDFVSRFFAPAAGVDEDPVTGSAHCALTPYWGKKLGKCEMVAYQASARGGVLKLRWNGNRVLLSGQAVTVLRGELLC